MRLSRPPLILTTDPSEVNLEAAGQAPGAIAGPSDPIAPTDGGGEGETPPTKIILGLLGNAPVITVQPVSQTITANSDVTFSITATGSPTLLYQWYVSEAVGGNNWTPIPGALNPSFTMDNVPQGDDQTKYRCIVSNNYGTATSDSAFLSVTPNGSKPYVTLDPVDAQGLLGDTVAFSVEVGGPPTITYQWQKSVNGGSSWTNLTDGGEYSGSLTPTLEVGPITAPDNGNLFRCVITNGAGSATSNSASLTISDPAIQAQPQPNNGAIGDTVSFEIVAEGLTSLSYQWQISTNGGATWTNLVDGGEYSGSQTDTLNVGPLTAPDNGNLFRCVVTDTAGSQISLGVGLTVNAPISHFVVDQGYTSPLDYILKNQVGTYGTTVSSGAITPVSFTGGYPPFFALSTPDGVYLNEGGASWSLNSTLTVEDEYTPGSGYVFQSGFYHPVWVDSEGQLSSDPGNTVINIPLIGLCILPSGPNSAVAGILAAPALSGTGGTYCVTNIQSYSAPQLGEGTGGAGELGGYYYNVPIPPDQFTVQGYDTAPPAGTFVFLIPCIFACPSGLYITPLGYSIIELTG